jgi:antitoxin component HigA of HigAB toxin-antitoxin module
MMPGIEITKELVQDDIKKLIEAELLNISNIESHSCDYIRAVLNENATVMFLWVKMVFKELQRCFNAVEMRFALENIPQSLEEEYDRLFSQLMNRLGSCSRVSPAATRSRTLFQLVLGAVEPLSLNELRHAYAAFCSSDHNWKEYILSEEGIIASMGGFVQIRNDRVYLGHASVGEYLNRKVTLNPTHPGADFFRTDPRELNGALAKSCINYLAVVEWASIIDPSVQEDSANAVLRTTEGMDGENTARYPFLSYASHRVFSHFFECVDDHEDIVGDAAEQMKGFIQSTSFCSFLEYSSQAAVAATMDSHEASFSPYIFITDFVQLEAWLNPTQAPDAGLCNIIRQELTRRSARYGEDDTRTQSWVRLADIMDHLIAIGVSNLETYPEVLAPDNISVLQHQSLSARGASVAAIAKKVFSHHSASAILRYAYEMSLIKLERLLSIPEDLMFEILLKACARLPAIVVVTVLAEYRAKTKITQAKLLSEVARVKCEGRGTFSEGIYWLNMGLLEKIVANTGGAVEHLRTASGIFHDLPSNGLYEIFRCNTDLCLTLSLMDLCTDTSVFEAVERLRHHVSAFLAQANPKSRGLHGPWDRYFIRVNTAIQSRLLVHIAWELLHNGYYSECIDLANILAEESAPLTSKEQEKTARQAILLKMRVSSAMGKLHRNRETTQEVA